MPGNRWAALGVAGLVLAVALGAFSLQPPAERTRPEGALGAAVPAGQRVGAQEVASAPIAPEWGREALAVLRELHYWTGPALPGAVQNEGDETIGGRALHWTRYSMDGDHSLPSSVTVLQDGRGDVVALRFSQNAGWRAWTPEQEAVRERHERMMRQLDFRLAGRSRVTGKKGGSQCFWRPEANQPLQ